MSIDVTDHEPAEWMNKLAREAPDGKWYPVEEYAREDVEFLAETVATDLDEDGEVWELESDTLLSPREAEVVALKKMGLTHNAIALYYAMHGGILRSEDGLELSRSTIDEYSRRAREKYHRARNTVRHLQDLYLRNVM